MVETGLMGSRSESVRRWWEHRHALWDVSPGELVALQKAGTLNESRVKTKVAQAEVDRQRAIG